MFITGLEPIPAPGAITNLGLNSKQEIVLNPNSDTGTFNDLTAKVSFKLPQLTSIVADSSSALTPLLVQTSGAVNTTSFVNQTVNPKLTSLIVNEKISCNSLDVNNLKLNTNSGTGNLLGLDNNKNIIFVSDGIISNLSSEFIFNVKDIINTGNITNTGNINTDKIQSNTITNGTDPSNTGNIFTNNGSLDNKGNINNSGSLVNRGNINIGGRITLPNPDTVIVTGVDTILGLNSTFQVGKLDIPDATVADKFLGLNPAGNVVKVSPPGDNIKSKSIVNTVSIAPPTAVPGVIITDGLKFSTKPLNDNNTTAVVGLSLNGEQNVTSYDIPFRMINVDNNTNNNIKTLNSIIIGGTNNSILISGKNTIQNNCKNSSILAGNDNTIQNNCTNSSITSGTGITIDSSFSNTTACMNLKNFGGRVKNIQAVFEFTNTNVVSKTNHIFVLKGSNNNVLFTLGNIATFSDGQEFIIINDSNIPKNIVFPILNTRVLICTENKITGPITQNGEQIFQLLGNKGVTLLLSRINADTDSFFYFY
jgi:hypothetical protein